ncbi:MAG: DUF423 domain-containing protein [Alphaproteobacteria bacterium]|nr:DUF423 domain-containing protein [Alphaproteobacteria bacterium]MDE2337302.1 DUF423 domain-containing protein [Alphaproteobacteria bacterium]
MTGIFAGLCGFWGMAGGALAAHAVKDPHAAAMVKTSANYALLHGIVLLCWPAEDKIALAAKACFAAGTFLFSGALAVKYLCGAAGAGIFAPAGGSLLMLGWLVVCARAAMRRPA